MFAKQLYTSAPVPSPIASAFIIRVEDFTAGVAIGDHKGFRFVSAHPNFDILDGSSFQRVDDVRLAAKRLALAKQPALSLQHAE